MYGKNLQLFTSKLIEYQFLTMCLKMYILRKTCGFAQISFHAQLSQKIFPVLHKLRKKNTAKPRKNSAKVRKKKNLSENSANLAISWKP